MYRPYADIINRIQNNQTVTNQSNRSDSQTFVPITISTNIPSLSIRPLVTLTIADTYSLSGPIDIPFQTNTILNTTANQFQTFFQPHTAPEKVYLQFYRHHVPL